MIVFKPAELFSRLQGGHVLVTGNSRLARVLSGQYGQWRMRNGEQQWPSPAIRPWIAWLDILWEQAGLHAAEGIDRPVPNRQQLQNLWENVLADPDNAGALLRPQALATQAMDTRRMAVEWGLSLDHPTWRGDNDENHAAFQRWNSAFESLCRQTGWLAPEERPGRLARVLEKGFRPAEDRIDLIGFDEFNPAQSELLEALSQAGVQVTEVALEPSGGDALYWKAADHRHELDRMTRWVRQRFSESADTSIAVIVPDLQARRDEIELVLQDILLPGASPCLSAERPWNVSLGTPLAQSPMIGSAFDLLALLNDRVEIQTVGAMLRSPWIRGADEEQSQRARLEKRLRDIYPRQLKLKEVDYQAKLFRRHARDGSDLPPEQHEPYPWNCPALVPVLSALLSFFEEQSRARPPSAWADAIEGLLRRCGWPAAGNEDSKSHEHDANWQAYQAWQEALRALASLDASAKPMSLAEAVSRMKRICLEQVFQPRTSSARIQVLGLYEANSLRFDHAWVLGLHSDNWPPPARPNPFIPRQLQLQAGLPHASPQRELDVARTVTRRLMEMARETVFSFPGQQDGENLLPSPLVRDILPPADEVAGWEGESWSQVQARGDKPRTVLLKGPGPLQGESARGGSRILKNQALCPFRAFAENRLGAEGLEAPVDGISGKLHGTLVHDALEHFWRETRTRDALLKLDEAELDERIHKHVQKALEEERGLMFRPHFKGVESARLQRLIKKYLKLDALRDEFTVEGFEREVLHEINGQTIRLFIDRVDRLADGRLAIIDYKTGRVDAKKWFGERPEDPQLPLYAVSSDEIPFGVVFAVIRNDECVFRGVVQDEGVFPGLPPKRRKDNAYLHEAGEDMPQTVEDWTQVLHSLMSDFLAGKADIDPKEGSRTCENSWCEMYSLCRIHELESAAPEHTP